MAAGTLTVQLLFGQGLSEKDADIFAKVKVGANHSVTTKTVEKARSPVWNETFSFPVGPRDDTVVIKVFKQKGLILNREELLGAATISLAEVRQAQSQQVQAPVVDEDRRHKGTLTVDLVFVPSAPPAVPMPEKAANPYPQVNPAQGNVSLQAATGYPGPSAPAYQPTPVAAATAAAVATGAAVATASAPPAPAVITVPSPAPAAAQAPPPGYPGAAPQAPPPGYYPAAPPPPAPVAYVPVYASYPGAPPPPAGMGAPYGYSVPPPGVPSSSATTTTVVQSESPSRRGGAAGAVVAGMVIGAGMERRHMRRVMRRI